MRADQIDLAIGGESVNAFWGRRQLRKTANGVAHETIDELSQTLKLQFTLRDREECDAGFDIILARDDLTDDEVGVFHFGTSEKYIESWMRTIRSELPLDKYDQFEHCNRDEAAKVLGECLRTYRHREGPAELNSSLYRIGERTTLASFQQWSLPSDGKIILRCQREHCTQAEFMLSIDFRTIPPELRIRVMIQPLPSPAPDLSHPTSPLAEGVDAIWTPLLAFCGLESLLRLAASSARMKRSIMTFHALNDKDKMDALVERWLERNVYFQECILGESQETILLEALSVFKSERFSFLLRLINSRPLVFEIRWRPFNNQTALFWIQTPMGTGGVSNSEAAVLSWPVNDVSLESQAATNLLFERLRGSDGLIDPYFGVPPSTTLQNMPGHKVRVVKPQIFRIVVVVQPIQAKCSPLPLLVDAVEEER